MLQVDALDPEVAVVEVEAEVWVIGLLHEPSGLFRRLKVVASMWLNGDDDVVFGGHVAQFEYQLDDALFASLPGGFGAEGGADDHWAVVEPERTAQLKGRPKLRQRGCAPLAFNAGREQGH